MTYWTSLSAEQKIFVWWTTSKVSSGSVESRPPISWNWSFFGCKMKHLNQNSPAASDWFWGATEIQLPDNLHRTDTCFQCIGVLVLQCQKVSESSWLYKLLSHSNSLHIVQHAVVWQGDKPHNSQTNVSVLRQFVIQDVYHAVHMLTPISYEILIRYLHVLLFYNCYCGLPHFQHIFSIALHLMRIQQE